MDRELIAGLRGFTENAAFIGGGLVTWLVSRVAPEPASTGDPLELWWYPMIVFLVFFAASIVCTMALVAKDKADEARRKLQDDVHTQTLRDVLAAIQSLKSPSMPMHPSTIPIAPPAPLNASVAPKGPAA